NRNRGRYDDRQNVYHLPTNHETYCTYNGALHATVTASIDGIDEYRATTFNSEMRGDLLVQKYNGVLYHAVHAADGLSLPSVTTLATTHGLDVVASPGGAILSFDHDGNQFVLMQPIDSAATTMIAYDIFPWRARADGTPTFTIGGVQFGTLADTSVTIGGLPATVTSVSSNRIRGILPANPSPSPQLLDVVIQSAGKTSVIPQPFRYMQRPNAGTASSQSGAALPAEAG